MGINNKARRAAKRRRERKGQGNGWRADSSSFRPFDGERDEAQIADHLVLLTIAAIHHGASAAGQAERLTGAGLRTQLITTAMARALAEIAAQAVRRRWTPVDLAEITRRQLSTRHLPLVAALVVAETHRHPAASVPRGWWEQISALETDRRTGSIAVGDLEVALEIAALLDRLPVLAEVMPRPGAQPGARPGPGEHAVAGAAGSRSPSKLLAKVRALLAKAESTEFPDEAEALAAKAQELIATHALDRFVRELDADGPDEPMSVRRLWIDPPYLVAKAMLVDAVAGANHCSAVLSEQLGFVTLVGHITDVEASEVLVTSLLVQADRAMLRHGRLDDRSGRSRTPSFRRSFLVAYATRIGERLRHVADDALNASTRSGELLPVLARADEQVRATTETLFPGVTPRSTTVSNGLGWAAGRAAADLALLDVHGAITEQAAG